MPISKGDFLLAKYILCSSPLNKIAIAREPSTRLRVLLMDSNTLLVFEYSCSKILAITSVSLSLLNLNPSFSS